MRYEGQAYRGINPKWSFNALSGEGAAIHGGRFNPKGVPALYLSTSSGGAFLEATQGFAYKFSPLTMCTYTIECDDIVDLTTEQSRQAANVEYEHLACPWFEAISNGAEPPSWTIFKALRPSCAGILVPSFAIGAKPEMTNLVLWKWQTEPPYKVQVFDPEQRLPKNQRSWQAE